VGYAPAGLGVYYGSSTATVSVLLIPKYLVKPSNISVTHDVALYNTVSPTTTRVEVRSGIAFECFYTPAFFTVGAQEKCVWGKTCEVAVDLRIGCMPCSISICS